MASLSSASLNPTTKPETDLAEWTSKIKALQKQVDADEEAEQKRLEDEIVAARQARLRRRSGMDSESLVNSLDISKDLNLHISAKGNAPNYSNNFDVERQTNRDTSLRKLMGTNNVYNPDKISAPVRPATEKPGSTSLASFIGGRASGPRLNRHAPQQDAHDPTQFVQPDTSHPHPIFGRGGIAMPGMADKKGSNVHNSNAGSESSERYRPSLTAKPKSPSPPTANVSSKSETSNLSSADISRRSFTGPSKVAERYVANVEVSSAHLGTDIPQPNRPFRTTKSTSSTPSPLFTKDTEQKQESYSRNSNSSDKFADRSLPKIPNPTSVLPPVSVSTSFSSASPPKAGSDKPNTYTSTITSIPKSTLPFVGAQNSVKPLTTRTHSPEKTRDTPLRKLMEVNDIHNPDNAGQAPQKSEVSSLAAFIGGRATGPRLNRHAPQQDVHDPTQFAQPDLSAPHPIFGKGGIAMPGMVTKPSSSHTKVDAETFLSTASKSTSPLGQSRNDEKAGIRVQKTTSSLKELENISISHSTQGRTSSFASSSVDRRLPTTKQFGTRTSTRDRTISTPSHSHTVRTSHDLSRSSVSPTPSSRSSNSKIGLTQSIRPDIKVPSISPQIPSTYMPSPAFQKPLSQKDPTPSISRLQGRGFVQSMVKVSAELETSSPTTPSPGKPVSGKKNAVLDRWQPNMQADGSPTRPTSSHPDVMRRSTTFNTNTTSNSLNVSTHATGGSRTLKSVASLPSLVKAAAPKEIDPPKPEPTRVDEILAHEKPPGLGSASTMVVIKPIKSSGDLSQIPWLDELGVKDGPTNFSRQDKGSHFSPHSEKATSSRKPLIHLTKDRARKVKKSKDAIDTIKDLPAFDTVCPGPAETDSSVEVVVKPQSVTAINSVALRAGGSRNSPAAALADSSEVSSVSNQWDGLHSIPRSSASPLKQNAESETPQHHASNRLLSGMMSSSENNTAELAPQNDLFISPRSSPAPPIGPPSQPSSSMTLPVNVAKIPPSPKRHSRIPSTGNRITVMEISQSLNDVVMSQNPLESCASPTNGTHEPDKLVEITSNSRTTLSQIQAEKRKSSYEKYSAIILPPLKEEATPTQTPVGTLTRVNANQRRSSIGEVERQGDLDKEHPNDDTGLLVAAKTIYLDHSDEAIPQVDFRSLLKPRRQPFKPSPDVQTVSVEVLSITGTTATPVSRNFDVFYDSEILAIIHRTKSKVSGLASTSVWCWLGRRTILGDQEDRKLQELATRYGTSCVIVHQLAEPCELIHMLGGCLAIRQGTRIHWTPENTTMHLVRSLNDIILIDEHDLSIKNLCSAFSYCVTILDSVYVWYGRGSTSRERKAALQYAEAMAKDFIPPIELYEGENDNDEMFWLILGDDGFAKADYWRWRKSFADIEPSIWKVDFGSGVPFMRPVEFISMEQDHQASVYIVNCVWEFFVLVCEHARGNRQAIRLALDTAMKLSKEVASTRPYTPTVHVLILPSQIPLDLLLNIRDFDEAWLNCGNIPDHMNLLPSSEAIDHLSKCSWERPVLKDHDMLPLGVGVSDAMRLPQV